jgi:hypothetical protein
VLWGALSGWIELGFSALLSSDEETFLQYAFFNTINKEANWILKEASL